jgi:hypothetical protein
MQYYLTTYAMLCFAMLCYAMLYYLTTYAVLYRAYMTPYEYTKLPRPLWPTATPDRAQCFTSFSPRGVEDMSLASLIVGGLEGPDAGPDTPGWKFAVFEELIDAEAAGASDRRGYLDKKISVYGNDLSKTLTLQLTLSAHGKITLCEPPGVWGKYPEGFSHLWSKTDVELSIITKSSKGFLSLLKTVGRKFGPGPLKPRKFKITHAHESICVISASSYAAGVYEVGVRATGASSILLSTVIVP